MTNSHLAFGLQESSEAAPSQFCRWVKNAEGILGHSLDGNESVDFYSIDGALEAYKAGVHSADYAARIQSIKRGSGRSILTDLVRETFD